MKRCFWAESDKHINLVEYHDNEWGVINHDDRYLFEMFVLESFHTGLSWLIILNKRESFRKAFDNFDPNMIINYDEDKINELLQDKGIVRNKLKIDATINNARRFLDVQKEFGSFDKYIWSFSANKVIYNDGKTLLTTNDLSDTVSKDLKKRGFRFMGSVTTYSYLQAIGIINDHLDYCFKFHRKEDSNEY